MTSKSFASALAPLGAQVRLLLLRFLLSFVVYSICRLIFCLYNQDLLEVGTAGQVALMFWGGLRFDLTAILYTSLLLTVLSLLPLPLAYSRGYQRMLTGLYRVITALAIVLNLGDVVYYRFTLKRTTMAVFEEFGEENPFNFLRFFIDYWGITLLGIAFIVAFCIIEGKLPRPRRRPTERLWTLSLTSLVLLVGSIYLSIVGARGGFTSETRPITLSNANIYIRRPQQRALVLNTPFCLIRTIGKASLPEYQYMPFAEVPTHFNSVYTPGTTPVSGKYKGRNVVLIIWESFAREWVGGLNQDIPGYRGFTPFVDSLMKRSYVFANAYANGVKSIDAMPSIFSSVIKPHVPFVLSIYSGNTIPSLPARLDSMGYSTAFFHGAPNGSMGFNAFVMQAGIKEYYGKTEYANDKDYDGHWGIWDEKFLQYVARELGKLPQPFFAAEFTLSSHHPFIVPDEYKQVLPKGTIPMHQAVAYTDMALRKFFETASKQPWYDNTLFVIVADHAVPGALPQYKTSVGTFRIPIIIFDPRGELVGRDTEHLACQADLYPTILDLVGDERPMVTFGGNPFDTARPRFVVQDMDGIYQMLEGDYALHFDGQKVTALYNLKTDPQQRHDLKDQPGTPLASMLPRLKAYLQDYAWRMKYNKLTELHPER